MYFSIFYNSIVYLLNEPFISIRPAVCHWKELLHEKLPNGIFKSDCQICLTKNIFEIL